MCFFLQCHSYRKRLGRRIKGNGQSIVTLENAMGETYIWMKKELNKTDEEIKNITVPELNMLLQRSNEPIYKREIDQKISDQKEKVKKYG